MLSTARTLPCYAFCACYRTPCNVFEFYFAFVLLSCVWWSFGEPNLAHTCYFMHFVFVDGCHGMHKAISDRSLVPWYAFAPRWPFGHDLHYGPRFHRPAVVEVGACSLVNPVSSPFHQRSKYLSGWLSLNRFSSQRLSLLEFFFPGWTNPVSD